MQSPIVAVRLEHIIRMPSLAHYASFKKTISKRFGSAYHHIIDREQPIYSTIHELNDTVIGMTQHKNVNYSFQNSIKKAGADHCASRNTQIVKSSYTSEFYMSLPLDRLFQSENV